MFPFLIRVQSGFDDKTESHGYFQTETGASSRGNVHSELGMLPIFKLILGHIKIAAMDIAQFHIGFIDHQFSFRETHGRGAITAATTLMEHKLAMSFP